MGRKWKLKPFLFIFLFLLSIYVLYRKLTKINDYDKEIVSNEITKINLNELFHIVKCLIKEAGDKIIEIRNNNELNIQNKLIDKSVVTQADLISHQILVHTLKYKYNNLNLMSEENSGTNDVDVDYYMNKCNTYTETPNDFLYSSNLLTVWIDPLDATQEYTENLVEYVSIMFCIAINGSPKAGIIHRPFINKTDWSWLTHDNSIIQEKSEAIDTKSSHKRIVVSRSHTGKVKSFVKKYLNNSEIIEAAGAGYKALYVARNKADLYLHTTRIYKWDLCAPTAIINSLKGRLTDIDGKNIDFSHNSETKSINGVIAAVKDFDFYLNAFAGKNIE